jgi:hypothetical protein
MGYIYKRNVPEWIVVNRGGIAMVCQAMAEGEVCAYGSAHRCWSATRARRASISLRASSNCRRRAGSPPESPRRMASRWPRSSATWAVWAASASPTSAVIPWRRPTRRSVRPAPGAGEGSGVSSFVATIGATGRAATGHGLLGTEGALEGAEAQEGMRAASTLQAVGTDGGGGGGGGIETDRG